MPAAACAPWFHLVRTLAAHRSAETFAAVLGQQLQAITGATQLTLHWDEGAARRQNALVGPTAPLPAQPPMVIGHVVREHGRHCIALGAEEGSAAWLVLGGVHDETALRFLVALAGEIGSMLADVRQFEARRARLSAVLNAAEAEWGAAPWREAALAAVTVAVAQALQSSIAVVVADEGTGGLRALSGRQLVQVRRTTLEDPRLCNTLRLAIQEQISLDLPPSVAVTLAHEVGGHEGASWFHLVPLRVGGYFNGLVGAGLAERPPAAPEGAPLPPAANQRHPLHHVRSFLLTVSKDLSDFIGHAALGEEAFVAGMQQESAHLGLDLHDSLLQDLSYIQLQLGRLELLLAHDTERALAIVREISRNVRLCAAEARQLTAHLTSTQPAGRLSAALEALVEKARGRFQGSVALDVRGDERDVGPRVTSQLLRIVQEALNNAWKHAEAAHVSVEVVYEDDRLRLSVCDDGLGFNPAERPSGHMGLSGMERRVAELGGRLLIDSAPGRGTAIRVELPV